MIKKAICAVAALAALVSLTLAAATADSQTVDGVDFTDWTGVSANTATGTLLGHSITLAANPTGEIDPPPASTLDGSAPTWNHSYFTPPLSRSDAIHFVASSPSYSYRLQFGAQVTNPILHLDSLGSTLSFAGSPSITRVSGESTFTVSGSDVTGQADTPGNDSSGTVQLNGTFSSIDLTATYPGHDGIYLQVGARPPTTTPPPPHIKAMHRVNLPSTTTNPTILYTAVTGNWTHLVWDLTGDHKPDIVSGPGQDAVRFQPPAGNPYVTVYPVGPGGRGPETRLQLAVRDVTWSGQAGQIQKRVDKLPPVYAAGPKNSMLSTASHGFDFACTLYGTTVTTDSGALQVKGCMKPVSSLADIPSKELGVIQPLAAGTWDCNGCSKPDLPLSPIADGLSITPGYISQGDVLVNGVKLHPSSDAAVVVYPSANLITSSNARLEAGHLTLANRPNFQIDASHAANGVIPLGTFGRLEDPKDGIGGFGLDGDVPVDLLPGTPTSPGQGLIKPNVVLPDWLTAVGKVFPVKVDVRVVNGAPALQGLHVGPVSGDIGAVGVKDFRIDYDEPTEEWRGQGALCALGTCRLTMDPAHGGGIIVRHNALKEAGADLDLTPGIPLFPGVDLTHINFHLELDPTVVAGGGRINAVDLVDLDGNAFAAFPSERAPWIPHFPPNFPDGFYGVPHYGLSVGISASTGVHTPIGTIPLGDGYFLYEDPGKISFGGGVHKDLLGILSYDGRFGGNLDAKRGLWRIGGHIGACVDLGIKNVCSPDADGIISSHGFGACFGGTAAATCTATTSPRSGC
jgi:hypothetical protein